ncbi:hypothetical protein QCA50_004748 [Cerrena zonata]|uniref:Uncharacterized protein n=1 Tax=Cerrena zonata TaxID=2478898 RepID=A0AAW0GHR6_9APHY
MHIRNRKPLGDKTPRNTPKPPKLYHPGSTKPLPPLKFPQEGPHDAKTLSVKPVSAIPKEFIQELLASPSPVKGKKPSGSMHSTPAPIKHHRGLVHPSGSPAPRASRQSFPSIRKPTPLRAPSPLPPSSPPSTTSLEYEYAPQPEPEQVVAEYEEQEEVVDFENVPLPQEPGSTHSQRSTTSDDPFGILAAEKKLKQRREEKRRHDKGKGKETAPKPRAPLSVLAYASPESQSPQPRAASKQTQSFPSVEPLAQAEDDDEDLYADPYILDSFDQAGPSRFPQDQFEDEDDGSTTDKENAPPEPLLPLQELPFTTTSPLPSPPKSPRPHHVDPSFYPMDSPFSSPSTPCDRDLAIDSVQSTPSPTKPMQVITPLKDFKAGAPSSAFKGTVKGKGRMSFPVWQPSESVRRTSSVIRALGLSDGVGVDDGGGDGDEGEDEDAEGNEVDVRIGPPGGKSKPAVAASSKGKRKLQVEPTAQDKPRKRPRTSARKADDKIEDPMEVTKKLEKLLPKRPVRKPKTNAPSQVKAKAKPAARKSSRTPKAQPTVDTSSSDPVDEEESEDWKTGSKRKAVGTGRPRGRPPKKPKVVPKVSAIAKGKMKATEVEEEEVEESLPSRSSGRMIVEVVITRRGQGRPRESVGTSPAAAPKSYKSTNSKTNAKPRVKVKGSGKAKAAVKRKGKGKQVESDGSESSGTRRRRQQRIEYFNKLDREYELAKEKVYVI